MPTFQTSKRNKNWIERLGVRKTELYAMIWEYLGYHKQPEIFFIEKVGL